MNIADFADAQKSHNVIFPKFDGLDDDIDEDTPFVKLLDGKETSDAMMKRWNLYHQLHSHFHTQVDNIVSNIEHDLKSEISSILFNDDEPRQQFFKSLFLMGSDSSIKIEFPEQTADTLNTLIDLSPKESPNVRMMLRRSMFKLVSIAENASNQLSTIKKEEEDHDDDCAEDVEEQEDGNGDVSYDLTLVENFKKLFGKNLNMVFMFKDVDSFSFNILDDFLILLKNALKNEHVKISLVFNVNTNLSNFEKNMKQSTIRLLKRNYHILDVSSNKGYKYGNRIFQSFLDTVDGKLNLSSRFVKFIIDKMSNNTNHNLQLLTKILDFSLMSYFYQNPFSIFIDPVNIEFLNDYYFELLAKCPTFMFFIDGLIKENVTSSEISSLLNNTNGKLEEFFVEFLVRDNPVIGHAKFVSQFLEDTLNIKNYNLIELYYNLLTGNLNEYLSMWPSCNEYLKDLSFEPIDTIFQELFTLDNSNGLLTTSLLPYYKTNMEETLLNWEKILPHVGTDLMNERVCGPIVSEVFKLYREANSMINIYDFYIAFREILPRNDVIQFLKDAKQFGEEETEILDFVSNNDDDAIFDKISLILFMQAIYDFEHMGFIKTTSTKSYDILEKCIWKGI
ncbi:hypothetical protein KAFR_0C06380 [Kazachstania africana CBS 2517]|uniref:Uncharacterized protein n=1 Tax=Kazachstania africana (strain ATCC 22294 / BCRC 22015 / CBS 2517 / CECT 1963 / NBRC 1671 / NRRL Y-8276) TaxID=1071382 RepID=H2ATD4_KAZAF|nr:hypothetical protein KAFR_0C06380 [Kazachstania africana CBS 2517]CCF57634.1 hypothetical protein KAFR_0C06380 [Kazachstania africana CBS 2517]